MSPSVTTSVSVLSEVSGSPVPSSSCIDLPELDFDLNAFLQSCSEFMSQPLTPSPIFNVPPILPDPAVTTPPYTSDEGSVSGDHEYPKHKSHPTITTVPQITLTMSSNRQFGSYQSPDPSIPSSSSMSMRTSQSSSQSQSPPITYSYSNPNIFASYPQSYPTTSYFPHHNTSVPLPASLTSSPPWQTTDTEANASGLDVDLDIDLEGITDDNEAKTSYSTASPHKAKTVGKDSIPRPPNAWILYRSDILKDLASGNDIPGLDAVLTKLGYGASTSASSDESHNESITLDQKGKSKELTDSETMPPPSVKKSKKGKKGAKVPTEEFLSLGKGKTGKGLPQAHISKLISTLWKNETEDRKAFYERKADIKKIEHQKKYPDYKFQPMRKADKVRQREEREREKEELKRQKEAEKQAGKAKRHRRPRTRMSPSSPYAVKVPEKRPDMGSLARSLSYSGESSKPSAQWWSPNPGAYNAPRRETEPSHNRYALGADPLGVYPFPVPFDALPALVPEEGGFHQQGPPGAMIAEDYQSWQQHQTQGPSNHRAQRQAVPSSGAPQTQTIQQVPGIPHSNQPVPVESISGSSSYHVDSSAMQSHPMMTVEQVPHQPLEGLGIYPTMHSAVPFIADPLPMDAQGRPMPILGLDDIQPFPEDDNGDPALLAEMWWNLQDEDVRDDMENTTGPSGLLADDRTLQVFEVDAEKAGQSSGTRVSIASTGTPSGATSAAPPTPSPSYLTQDPFNYSNNQVAYPYPQGYVPMYVSVIPEDGNIDPSIPFFAPGYDANLPYLPMDAALDPSIYVPGGSSYDEQGPFLFTQQPMSPTETWSAGPTPREATFLRAAQSQETNRIPSNSSEGTVRTVSSSNNNNQTAPRYVSASAYPLTPVSQDPGSLPGTNGIVDRNTSYSVLAAVMSGQSMGMNMGMGVSDDILGWDDNDVIEHDEEDDQIGTQPTKERVTSQIYQSKVNTPVSAQTPMIQLPAYSQPQTQLPTESIPVSVSKGSEKQQDSSSLPRKVATRSRAVAAKFNGE